MYFPKDVMKQQRYILNMIKPYYETELGKLYHGDCLDVMQEIDNVNLVITDPPYGIHEMAYRKNRSRTRLTKTVDYGKFDWARNIPEKKYFDEIKRISENQIIFGGNYFVEYLYNSRCWIVWDKQMTGNFAECELAWTSFNQSVKKYTVMWNGMIRVEKEYKRQHPTKKPIRLFTQILDDFSKENDLICDPYLGSGTTAIACERLNRCWIGIEISKEYCDIAVDRIKKETAQYKLPLAHNKQL